MLIYIIFSILIPLPTLTKMPKNFLSWKNMEDSRKSIGNYTNLKAKDYPILKPKNLPPKFFDARKKWPKCESIRKPSEQGNCGSCWAQAVTSAISDRWCITYGPKEQRFFSAEDLTTCCLECIAHPNGCKGGHLNRAYYYWITTGIVSGGHYGSKIGCKPYSDNLYYYDHQSTNILKCKQECTNRSYSTPYSKDRKKGYDVNVIITRDVQRIQWEILFRGPVQASFDIFFDILNFTCSGVYSSTGESTKIGHSVVIIGWGEEKGLSYWLIKNTWGEDWCNGGFFKIKREVNEDFVEQKIYAPIIERPAETVLATALTTSKPSKASFIKKRLYEFVVFFCIINCLVRITIKL